MNAISIARTSSISSNLEIFDNFAQALKTPIRFSNGDLLASVKLTCYNGHSIYSFNGKIILFNNGTSKGRIWIDDGQRAASPENILLATKERKYFAGRGGSELTIEASNPYSPLKRIDLEEILM